MRHNYEVIVGNIGTVYRGPSAEKAQSTFAEYREQSKAGHGRAGNEDVTALKDGEIYAEHTA